MIKKIIKKIANFAGYVFIKKTDNELENTTNFNKDIIKKFSKYTMTSNVKIFSLIKAFEYVNKFKIAGDFVECGVWQGGNIMALKHLENIYKTNNKIYGYDTFLGMSEPTKYDVKITDGTIATNKFEKFKDDDEFSEWDKCTIEKVTENFAKHNLGMNNLKLVKGKVENTLLVKSNLPENISLLRLDTDFYESTKIELEILYPLLSKGGVLIIDDYGAWQGAKKAVDEYFKDSVVWMHYIDHDCRLIIK